MASRRALSSLLRSTARRSPSTKSAFSNPRSLSPSPLSGPNPTGFLLSRVPEYATASVPAPETPAKGPVGSPTSANGKITDEFTGADSIGQVPVGGATLRQIINVIGEPIDERGDIKTSHFLPIHREALAFVEQATEQQILLVTGIKVVDLLAPYQRGGNIGLFGGAGVGKVKVGPTLGSNIRCLWTGEKAINRPIFHRGIGSNFARGNCTASESIFDDKKHFVEHEEKEKTTTTAIHSLICTKLLTTSAHLGRRVAAHHFKTYICGTRNGMTILDSDKTLICLRNALHFVRALIRQKGRFLFLKVDNIFVNEIMEEMMSRINDSQWNIGSLMTNPCALPKKISRKKKINLGTIHQPDCIVILDAEGNPSVIREADHAQIPIVSLVDPQISLESYKRISYPIPVNVTDQFVYMFCHLITKMVNFERDRIGVPVVIEDIEEIADKLDEKGDSVRTTEEGGVGLSPLSAS